MILLEAFLQNLSKAIKVSNSSFGSDLLAVLKSRITVIICGILTSIITARYLGPEGNGILATLIVYPALFMTIGSLGIRQSTAYFIGQEKYSDNDVFSGVLQIWIFTSIFCMLVCYSLVKLTTKGNYDDLLVFLAISPIPFALITTYSSGLFLGKNKIKDFNTVNWVPNVVKFFSYILFIILLGWNVYGALFGITLGYIILSVLIYKKVKGIVAFKWKFDKKIIKDLLSLGIVYAISLFVISLNYKIDVALLERFSTEYEVGIYSKGVSVVEYIWEVPTLLSTIVFARSATAKDSNAFSLKVVQLLRICFVVILIVSIGFFFLSDFLMVTMYGEEFKESAMVQKLILPGIFLLTIFKVLNMDMAGRGKPWVAMIAMIPSLIINIMLNWYLDPKYGANGAAIASSVSYTISAVLFLFMYSRTIQMPLKEILRFQVSDFNFLKEYYIKFTNKNNED